MSNIIIPGEEKLNDGLAEIIGEKPAPDLLGIAQQHHLMDNASPGPVPEWVNKALLRAGGTNKFGEPNFRAVFGQTETTFAWGQQRLKYPAVNINESELLGHDIHNANGTVHFVKGSKIPSKLRPGSFILPRYRKVKKEIGLPFWIIERWFDVTEIFYPTKYFFLPLHEAWEKEIRWDYDEETGQQIDNMGPFPARGVYQHFFTVKTPDLKYRPIDEDVINIVAMTLEAERQVASGREYSLVLKELIEKKQAKEREPFERLREKIEDAFNTPRILGNASVTVPSMPSGE